MNRTLLALGATAGALGCYALTASSPVTLGLGISAAIGTAVTAATSSRPMTLHVGDLHGWGAASIGMVTTLIGLWVVGLPAAICIAAVSAAVFTHAQAVATRHQPRANFTVIKVTDYRVHQASAAALPDQIAC